MRLRLVGLSTCREFRPRYGSDLLVSGYPSISEREYNVGAPASIAAARCGKAALTSHIASLCLKRYSLRRTLVSVLDNPLPDRRLHVADSLNLLYAIWRGINV